jgi:hypothetical protein
MPFWQARLENLVTSSRTFPVTARVDLQFALENCSKIIPM